jgi:hypothetical protein
MGVFVMTLIHFRAALLQNSRVEQLCFGVFGVFGEKVIVSSRNAIFEGVNTFLPLV